MLDQAASDVEAECRELDIYISGLDDAAWNSRTAFFDWTVRDQILHLHQVDRFALASLRSADAFARAKRAVREHQAEGIELSAHVRQEFAEVDRATILATWRETYLALVDALRRSEPKARITWFGPDMSVVSMASARQMEVWAHGQDIYDLFVQSRPVHPRLRNICEIGARTFGWSFVNRGLEVPDMPAVTLAGADGEPWHWPGAGNGAVTGPALHFALVVTQRRAVEDTRLIRDGEAATHWMEIAQCFAGAPQQRAEPGSRPITNIGA